MLSQTPESSVQQTQLTNTPLCRFSGGIRYGLAPSQRWRRTQRLPSDYAYGTRDQPGQCDRLSGVCPQPSFMNVSFRDEWTEDCFQCNVWVHEAEPPKEGWPVFVFLHGRFLQFGTPNTFSAAALLGETDFNAIIVMPAYRLGTPGSVGETVGNHGFWDQRLALEWTRDNITLFGGNPLQVTISGYSAGESPSTFQISILISSQSLIKQACIWSNSPGVQPKNEAAAQLQFNQLLSALSIPRPCPGQKKLSRLRSTPAKTLLDAVTSIELHLFRPTSDSTFIDPSPFNECRDERSLYATLHPPQSNTLQSLHRRVQADYPRHIADALIKIYCNAGHLLYRYGIEKRLRYADRTIPPSWGVTHATDQYLWFWGNGEALQAEERSPWCGRRTGDYRQVRTLRPDGSVQICEDGLWDDAMRVGGR
ncbi:putative carboxylesterase [Aspergillus novofumigatus IBT 16806]|uniref:Carboxylic ester hydrolase n=1 Tax=Aspergillus novofumigatus (strain IBT 16806) TaxID=1392255 RepID=A0A2I1C5T6_ASPN1|nr:alpha/beta-hydrolase [Aspergillus novofumigatus IBT 16806]PKX93030.1 alpha/beta-hydrolase [Aspergillus novofumigatus IBT 16806]